MINIWEKMECSRSGQALNLWVVLCKNHIFGQYQISEFGQSQILTRIKYQILPNLKSQVLTSIKSQIFPQPHHSCPWIV